MLIASASTAASDDKASGISMSVIQQSAAGNTINDAAATYPSKLSAFRAPIGAKEKLKFILKPSHKYETILLVLGNTESTKKATFQVQMSNSKYSFELVSNNLL